MPISRECSPATRTIIRGNGLPARHCELRVRETNQLQEDFESSKYLFVGEFS